MPDAPTLTADILRRLPGTDAGLAARAGAWIAQYRDIAAATAALIWADNKPADLPLLSLLLAYTAQHQTFTVTWTDAEGFYCATVFSDLSEARAEAEKRGGAVVPAVAERVAA